MRLPLALALALAVAACSKSSDAAAGVTRIDAGAGLSGGPITGTGTLRVAPAGIDGTLLAPGAVTTAHLAFDPVTQAEFDGHDHDGRYAPLVHAHDAVYAAIVHGHPASEILDLAAAAVGAMGPKGSTNPLHHDRYTDAEAVGAVAATGAYLPVAGGTLTGPIDLALQAPRNLRVESATTAGAPACGAASAGALYFNTTVQALELCTGSAWVRLAPLVPGSSSAFPGASCKALQQADPSLPSGTYWIDFDGPGGADPVQCHCDMTLVGGGWTMLLNSVLGVETTRFWNIPYIRRLYRRGLPGLGGNFYDGSLYGRGSEVLDVVEDLAGQQAVLVHATYAGFEMSQMRFVSPVQLSGDATVFSQHVAGGWASVDYDGDTGPGNCAVMYANVSQHYGSCFAYSLGADGDPPAEDGGVGPHLSTAVASSLGLVGDGTAYTRVRRITRYVR